MTPIEFPQQTKILKKPAGMEDCSDLPVYSDGVYVISCWKLGFWERIELLFTGKLWLWVVSKNTQPPVSLSTENPFTPKQPEDVQL